MVWNTGSLYWESSALTTRPLVISVICSVYDPLGLARPFFLQGRRLLQDLCQVMHGWDKMLHETSVKWEA